MSFLEFVPAIVLLAGMVLSSLYLIDARKITARQYRVSMSFVVGGLIAAAISGRAFHNDDLALAILMLAPLLWFIYGIPVLAHLTRESDEREKRKKPPWRIPCDSIAEPPVVPANILLIKTVISYSGDVTDYRTATFVTECLAAIKSPPEDGKVLIKLDTCGGQVKDIDTIRAHIKLLRTVASVRIVVTGVCKSAGMSIFTAVPVEDRSAMEDVEFMMHRTSTEYSNGDVARRDELDSETRYAQRRSDETIIRRISSTTGIPADHIRKIFNANLDYNFFPLEAYRLGVIGAVVSEEPTHK